MLHLVDLLVFITSWVAATGGAAGVLAERDRAGVYRLTLSNKRFALVSGAVIAAVVTFFVGPM